LKLDRHRLQRAREMLGYGIEKTAQEAGVSKNSVLRAEHEQDIRPVTARKIAQALHVPVADLLPKAQSPLPLEYEPAEPQRARIEEAQDIDEAARIFEEAIKERMEHPGALDAALEAAKRQAAHDSQAAYRARESGRVQLSSLRHEKDTVAYLMQLDKEEVASALLNMASMVVALKTQSECGAETASEAASRSASA
jgi:transcriptional regulator with XRE-family HTH domain